MINNSNEYKASVYAPIRQFDSRITMNLNDGTGDKVYDDEYITKINIVEEMSIINDTMPSNQLTITLNNDSGTFNFLTLQNMAQIIAKQPSIFVEFGLVLANYQDDSMISDYVGKIAGSLVENGNIMEGMGSTTLQAPSTFTAELNQTSYDLVESLNGSVSSATTTVNLQYAQRLFSFDIIRALTDKFGTGIWQGKTTLAEKVAIAKTIVKSWQMDWSGYGTSPLGNKAYTSVWGGSSWGTIKSHTNGTVTKLSIPSTSTTFIMSDGFMYFNAYADVSDGVIASNIMTDCITLTINTNPIYYAEWVPMGKYFIDQFKNDNNGLTVTLTCHDKLIMLENIAYAPKSFSNAYDMVVDVFTVAGLTSGQYFIDQSLKTTSGKAITVAFNCRSMLQNIGVATKSTVYQDRLGILTVKPFKTLQESALYINYPTTQLSLFGYTTSMKAGSNQTGLNSITESTDGGMRSIDFDQMYEMPEVMLDKSIYQLTINVYHATNGTIVSTAVYTNSAVSGTNGQSFTIDNPLISTTAMAQSVANWFFTESNYNAIFKNNWRANPVLECGDVIIVEDPLTGGKQARIIKQEFNYEGYLTGTTESRGGI